MAKTTRKSIKKTKKPARKSYRRKSFSKNMSSHGKFKGDMSFHTSIKRVLKQVNPGCKISTDALNQLNAFLNLIGKTLIMTSLNVKDIKTSVSKRGSLMQKQTLDIGHMRTAIKLCMPGELSKHAISEATSNALKTNGRKLDKKSIPIQSSRVLTLIRRFYKGRLGRLVSLYLTCAIDYLCMEITEIASKGANKDNRWKITIPDLMHACGNDEELSKLCNDMNWGWFEGGVFPSFTVGRLKQKLERLKTKQSFGSGRGKGGKGLGKSGASRKRKNIYLNTVDGLSNPAFQRLGKRAGIERMNRVCYDELRSILYMYLTRLVKNVVEYTYASGRRTVSKEDIYSASHAKGFPPDQIKRIKFLFGSIPLRSSFGAKKSATKNRISRLTKQIKKMEYYQKTAGFLLRKLPFKRVVKEIVQSFNNNYREVRFSAGAMVYLQEVAEDYIVRLLRSAGILLELQGKNTLRPKELQVVRVITRDSDIRM